MKQRVSKVWRAVASIAGKAVYAGKRKCKRLGCAWILCIGVLSLGLLTGCASYPDYGYGEADWYGYYGPGYYGDFWGPDIYVYGDRHHGFFGHEHDRRGFASRRFGDGFHGGSHGGGVFHGGGGFAHGGGHGGGGGHGSGGGHGR